MRFDVRFSCYINSGVAAKVATLSKPIIMKKFIYSLCLLSLCFTSFANNLELVMDKETLTENLTVVDVVTDINDNNYVAMTFNQDAYLGNGSIKDTLSINAISESAIAIYDNQGDYQSYIQFSSSPSGSARIEKMKMLTNNYMLVSLTFRDAVIIETDTSFTSFYASNANVLRGAIVLLDENANLVWLRQYASGTADVNTAVLDFDIDELGNTYILAEINWKDYRVNLGNIQQINPNQANDNRGAIIEKIDPNGTLLSTTKLLGDFRKLAVETENDVYATGFLEDGVEYFVNGNAVFSGGSDAIFMTRIVNNAFFGNHFVGGNQITQVKELFVDNGNLFFAGTSYAGVAGAPNASTYTMYIASIDFSNGNVNFSKSFAGANSNNEPLSVFQKDSSIYLTGVFSNQLYLDNDTINSYGGYDHFIADFSLQGDLNQLYHIGSSSSDNYAMQSCAAENGIVLTGMISKNGDISLDGSAYQPYSSSSFFAPNFIARYEKPTTINLDLGAAIFSCTDTIIVSPITDSQYTYEWNTGSMFHFTNITQSGTYWLDIFDSNNVLLASDTIEVTIEEELELFAAIDTLVTGSLVLEIPYQGTYQWSTGSNQNFIEVDSSGIYSVEYTSLLGCISTDTINVTVNTSTSLTQQSEMHIQLYPNPAHDVLHISNADEVIKAIQVYGLNGALIKNTIGTSTLFVDDLQVGTYLVAVELKNNRVYYQTFIKQ